MASRTRQSEKRGPGRPLGARDWRLDLSKSKIAKLKRKLLSMALKGDARAMQLCADRLWPKPRSPALPVEVATKSTNVADQGAAIINAGLSGQITPDVLKDLLSALADQAKLVEFTQIEDRLAALETANDTPLWMKPSQDPALLPIRRRKRRKNA